MIQLTPEDHAQAAALAARMKAEFPKHPPKIAIAAVHMLTLEIAVQLSGGKKKAALDYLKAMAHDGRDSIRRYFAAVEEKSRIEAEAAKERAHALAPLTLGTKENAR
jgi:hypothetical protein